MPILGIMASAMSANLWQPQGAYDALSTVTVPSGGLASVTFAGIPNTYKHLQIRCSTLRTTNPGILMQINGDATAGNYPQHILYGDGASAAAYADITNYTGFVWGANDLGTTTIPGIGIIDILDYANTSKLKTFRSLTGTDKNGSGTIAFASGFNKVITSAITSITFNGAGANFNQNSTFTLYGVK